MKPPPRQRILPDRYDPERERKRTQHNVCTWSRREQRKLLAQLELLKGSPIDYVELHKKLPLRSVPQLRSMVDRLQVRAVSIGAHQLLNQRRAEELDPRREENAVQPWLDMASLLAGDLEEPICTAFSQMLVVSSTEPQTVGNSAAAPPWSGPAPPTQTVPVPQASSGNPPRGATAPSINPAPPATSAEATTAPPSLALPGAGCPATSPAPQLLPQASGVAGATDDPAGTGVEPVKGTHGESEQEQRLKFSVDFQKIYLYLANTRMENVHSRLTPMECAVVLDLLLALPEELPLLDCTALRQHVTEAYASLSAPASNSELGAGSRKDPKAGVRATPRMAETPKMPAPRPASEAHVCPLNPFQVPLRLLVKRT